MTFEMPTLDTAVFEVPSGEELEALHAAELRAASRAGIEAVHATTGLPASKVHDRLAKAVGVKKAGETDDHDLRECLRLMHAWLTDPAFALPAARRRPLGMRPAGVGELPVPRAITQAVTAMACGLCMDPVKAGERIGRMRTPRAPLAAMGWLCEHCLFQRRHHPRRRDVLLRVFHHLFADNGIDLNAHECQVLVTWLTEDPGTASAPAWKRDPLDVTLRRLKQGVAVTKAATWLATSTAHTIVALLKETPALSSAEAELLQAIAQHLDEWQTNPYRLDARRYGTGVRYRQQVLKITEHPTVLSIHGGPFDLHTAPEHLVRMDAAGLSPGDLAHRVA